MKYQFHGVAKFFDKARTKLRGTDVLDAQHAQKACAAAETLIAEIAAGRPQSASPASVLKMFRGEK
jgi:hypothetical protein